MFTELLFLLLVPSPLSYVSQALTEAPASSPHHSYWLRFSALHSSHPPVRPLSALCPQAFAEAFEAFDITLEEFLSDTMTLKSVVLYHVLDSEVGKVWWGVGT